MKTKFFILIIWVCTATTMFAQSVITVQHGNSTSIYSTFDAAVAGALSGDYIYLPGGFFSGNQVNIDKKLNIIGAGFHPDSSSATAVTTLSFEIVFTLGSDSSFLSGISNNNIIRINNSNITIQRCLLGTVILGNSNYSNIRILENIFQGLLSLQCYPTRSYLNCLISKNIIYGNLNAYSGFQTDIFNSVNFQNNIFLLSNNYFNGSYSLGNCFFLNNIFLSSYNGFLQTSAGTQINNNLFNITNNAGFNTSNRFDEPIGNIFINYTSGSTAWDHSQNFHLKPGCNGIGLGTDGTDVGIYGTNDPFKEGGIPFNPHFQSISIPGSTSPNGTLDINIQVKAQSK